MTDETEAVGLALCQNALGPKQCPCAEKGVFNCTDAYPGYQAKAAITALDKHRIERAGDVERELMAGDLCSVELAPQAAATIAALRAEIERAKLDGVRAGIEAAIECVEMGAAFGCVIAEAPAAVRDLLNHAEAITKGEG